MEEKVTMGFKRSFSNHWLRIRLSLSSNNVRNCKETTTFVKLKLRRKESSIWRINKGLYVKNPNSSASLKKCIKKWSK